MRHDYDMIEDELHFLFNCRLYDQERLQLFAKCEQVNKSFQFKWNFISQTDNKQLIYQYMQNNNVQVAFEKRRAHL